MRAKYTASLCHVEGANVVPYEHTDIVAANDIDAIRQAEKWAKAGPVDSEDKLVVKRGGLSIYFQPVGSTNRIKG